MRECIRVCMYGVVRLKAEQLEEKKHLFRGLSRNNVCVQDRKYNLLVLNNKKEKLKELNGKNPIISSFT